MSKTKVILDTDGGTDDDWAVATLLKCEEKCNIEIKAITIVAGNTALNHACQNILLILKTLNRLDVPVYAGAENSLIIKPNLKPSYHGSDGLKDVLKPEDKPSLDMLQKKHAVVALKDLIDENPNEIVVFAIGPLTNIALLYKMYPRISEKIKSLYLMGGNHLGMGNITKCAEFNFYFDPESAKIVLHETKCPKYILPFEPCHKASFSTPHKEWRFSVLNRIKSEFIELMDSVEINIEYRKNFIPCDAYLIACFAFPKMITQMSEQFVDVELSGEHTRGKK